VQRLFSMFPQGGPGFALLLLRISVAAIFLIEGVKRFGFSSDILLGGIFAVSIALAIGFLTPLLSVLVCVSAAAALLTGFSSDTLVLVSLILTSAALSLLGPGAYSVDARLFGRRVMIVPPRKDPDQI